MRERQLEALYRYRLNERRNSDESLQALYDELTAGRNIVDRAWLFAVAQPRIPTIGHRLDKETARTIVSAAQRRTLAGVRRNMGTHPIAMVDALNPRRGLRRWVFGKPTGVWQESWMAIHESGAVTLAHAIGGFRVASDENAPGGRILSRSIECAVSDLMALLRETSSALEVMTEYDFVLGIEYQGTSIAIESVDDFGTRWDDTSTLLPSYTKVRSSVRLDVDDEGFRAQVCEIARDAVNQGGVSDLQVLRPPDE
jgi:hypothetical protein